MKKAKLILSYDNILYCMQSKHRDKVLNILVGHNKSSFFVGMAEILLTINHLKKEFPEDSMQHEKEGAEDLTRFIIDIHKKRGLVIPPELMPVMIKA